VSYEIHQLIFDSENSLECEIIVRWIFRSKAKYTDFKNALEVGNVNQLL